MKRGRVFLATTAGPDAWAAQVDPLTIHVARNGDDVTLVLDWERADLHGKRTGTLLLRLPATDAVTVLGQLAHHTSPELAQARRKAVASGR